MPTETEIRREILRDRPHSVYPLDEGTGTTAKQIIAGGMADGTYTSATLRDRPLRPGLAAAPSLPQNAYVTLGSFAGSTTNQGCFELLVAASAFNGVGDAFINTLIGIETATLALEMRFGNDGTSATQGKLAGVIVNSTSATCVEGAASSVNRPYHAAFRFTSSRLEVYKNGRLVAATAHSTSFFSAQTMRVGSIGVSPPSRELTGWARWACIYDRAISPNRILAHARMFGVA